MKRLKLGFAAIILSILTSACGALGPGKSIEINCDEFYETPHILSDTVEVKAGDEFSVNLCSNPTTGFQWLEEVENSAPDVVAQISHEFGEAPEKGKPAPLGNPSGQIWTFQALKNGTSTLSFEYSRNWEGGEKGAWTYKLTLEVK